MSDDAEMGAPLDRLDAHSRLVTDRLVLEPLRVEHADEMAAVLSDPALYEFIGGDPPAVAQLAERYQRQVAGPGRAHELWRNWVIRRAQDGAAAGFVQATLTSDGGEWTAEVAWVVGARFQNTGIATEAAAAVLEHLAQIGVAAFRAHIADGNVASVRIATRLGLARTDLIEQDERLYVCRSDALPRSRPPGWSPDRD